MARTGKIRNHGAIPERRHDAFLLALLLAVSLNVAVFAVQALIPKLAHLLRLLGPEPALEQPRDEETALPFILVSPDLLEEEIDRENVAAESTISRDARQSETADLPEDQPLVEEGVTEILTMPEGSMGPESGTHDAPEAEGAETEQLEEVQAETIHDTPGEDAPAAEYEDAPDPEPAEAPDAVPEPVEPLPPPLPELEMPVREPEPEPLPDPVEEWMPPPPVQELPHPQPVPEPVAEPPPEPVEELPPEPEPPEMPPEPLPPDPAPQPIPTSELIDLASLPLSPDGYFDPQRQYMEELARQSQPVIPPPPPQRREPQEIYQQIQPPQPQAYQTWEPAVAQPQQPVQQQRDRTGRPQATFQKIGGANSAASTPSVSGGSPRRVNRDTRVNLLESDPNMKVLAHRYGAYMEKLARLLQQSLNREVMLNPTFYARGQAKIYFTIAADGTLAYYDTQYPAPGEQDFVRVTSEKTVINAGPFDLPTREMLNDPLFRRMSVTVNLY